VWAATAPLTLCRTPGVVCMAQSGDDIWCGCDDGRIVVWGVSDDKLRRTFRPHVGRVSAVAVVGKQVCMLSRVPCFGCHTGIYLDL
jgi:hypothetical protein